MKAILGKVWCHLSLSNQEKCTVKEVRSSDALNVFNYDELVRHIAYISFHNPEYSIFFRSQPEDYKNKEKLSVMYPSIYRGLSNLSERYHKLKNRFDILNTEEQLLLTEFRKSRFLGVSKLEKYREIRWAVLQHYNVCETPLLDVTHSLRVACSFAIHQSNNYAHIFILGFPHINGSITYSVDEELLNVKLLSICPPKAVRPYFQEGFLVGSFPSSESKRSIQLNIARRLIAKFRINCKEFIKRGFQGIPYELLFPTQDSVKNVCSRIKDQTKIKST